MDTNYTPHQKRYFAEQLKLLCLVIAITIELGKFDTQLMQNPDISGMEY